MKYSTQVKPISYLKSHAAEIVTTLTQTREPCSSPRMVKPSSLSWTSRVSKNRSKRWRSCNCSPRADRKSRKAESPAQPTSLPASMRWTRRTKIELSGPAARRRRGGSARDTTSYPQALLATDLACRLCQDQARHQQSRTVSTARPPAGRIGRCTLPGNHRREESGDLRSYRSDRIRTPHLRLPSGSQGETGTQVLTANHSPIGSHPGQVRPIPAPATPATPSPARRPRCPADRPGNRRSPAPCRRRYRTA